jgi:hypothetical protein
MWRTLAAAAASERLAAWVEIETQVESQGGWVGGCYWAGLGIIIYTVMMHCVFFTWRIAGWWMFAVMMTRLYAVFL